MEAGFPHSLSFISDCEHQQLHGTSDRVSTELAKHNQHQAIYPFGLKLQAIHNTYEAIRLP